MDGFNSDYSSVCVSEQISLVNGLILEFKQIMDYTNRCHHSPLPSDLCITYADVLMNNSCDEISSAQAS